MTSNSHVPHIIRTAADPRQSGMHTVFVSDIQEVNENIRLILLLIPTDEPAFSHLPGQWLDVQIPGVNEIGGFTITSPPSTSILAPLNRKPYLELAIQRSPEHPPAAFFWRPRSEIRGTELQVRVGGNFVWPPPQLSSSDIAPQHLKRAIFVAGGLGINPLMSMLSFMSEKGIWPSAVRIFYTVRLPSQEASEKPRTLNSILFFTRLNAIVRDARTWHADIKFRLIVTGVPSDYEPLQFAVENGATDEADTNHANDSDDQDQVGDPNLWPSTAEASCGKRIQWDEIQDAIGTPEERKSAVVYVCGPPNMTDEIVGRLKGEEMMPAERVYCEKWW